MTSALHPACEVIPFPAPRARPKSPWRTLDVQVEGLRPMRLSGLLAAHTPFGPQGLLVRAEESEDGSLSVELEYGPALRTLSWEDGAAEASWDGRLDSDLRLPARSCAEVSLDLRDLPEDVLRSPSSEDLLAAVALAAIRSGTDVTKRPSPAGPSGANALRPSSCAHVGHWRVCRGHDGSIHAAVPRALGESVGLVASVRPDAGGAFLIVEVSEDDPLLTGPWDGSSLRPLSGSAPGPAGILRLPAGRAPVRAWAALWDTDPAAAASLASGGIGSILDAACAPGSPPMASVGCADLRGLLAGAVLSMAPGAKGAVEVSSDGSFEPASVVQDDLRSDLSVLLRDVLDGVGYRPGVLRSPADPSDFASASALAEEGILPLSREVPFLLDLQAGVPARERRALSRRWLEWVSKGQSGGPSG